MPVYVIWAKGGGDRGKGGERLETDGSLHRTDHSTVATGLGSFLEREGSLVQSTGGGIGVR